MKAARWVELGRVVCEDVPAPSVAAGEILIRTAYASICGSDLHGVFGRAPSGPAAPGAPGHESVGEVVESRCPGFEPGDQVLTVPFAVDGRCLAEFQALPGANCLLLPPAAPLSHLLMAQQLGTVIYGLRSHPVDVVGQDAVVIGQGSAGAFFTFLLKRAGAARVLVSDKSPARLAYSRQLGADLAVDVSTEAGADDFRRQVLAATGGRGAGVVVEAVGSREAFPLSLELAGNGATLVWFGLPEDGGGHYPFSFEEFFRRRLTAHTKFGAQGEPGLGSFRYAIRLIADGTLDVAPLLSHMLPIERVGEAFRIARDRSGNALKVSVKF